MINRQALLADLQKFLQRIEADLLERSESTEVPEVSAALHAEYEKAAKAERTAQNYEDWRTDTITQAAAAWVLSCVFVRFLEDNSLIDPPKIAGPGERLARARDEHELYFRLHPQHTDREYLLSVFGELAKLPGTKDIFGEHNAINDLPNWLSGDAAGELLNFFQKIDASTGDLVHDFSDSNWDTRFLGDLYQDLSEAARKKFALLQTPDFVEEFILDRTLEPAVEEFGLVPKPSPIDQQSQAHFKMIDPACGSGHFLLGAFPRLLERWQRKEPGTNIRELTQRTLDSIHGVDINPFAVAIAKFRLLLVALKACHIQQLAGAPGFHIRVACGDSLLHGENRTSSGQKLWDYAEGATDQELYAHAYPGEDLQRVRTLLHPGSYHCVVGNPPYIVPKDRKLGDWYRKRFSACHMQYSLAVPFMQEIFQLAIPGGFTGQITANSFMKREFGKKLIESFLPTIDLTHVIDTSGAYIPGHGTPTTILFGRKQEPVSKVVRTVMGIRGEPTAPTIAAKGLVWSAIVSQVDIGHSKNEFVSTSETPRDLLGKHPWSIGGGGTAELKKKLDDEATRKLIDMTIHMGRVAHTGDDAAYIADKCALLRRKIAATNISEFVEGDRLRDYQLLGGESILFPYDRDLRVEREDLHQPTFRWLWYFRAELWERREPNGNHREIGKTWFEYSRFHPERYRGVGIGYAYVSTHNHFVLDTGDKIFKQSAPVIRLKPEYSHEYKQILALLNCSTSCFWLRLSSSDKGMSGGVVEEQFERFFMLNGTTVGNIPVPEVDAIVGMEELCNLALTVHASRPEAVLSKYFDSNKSDLTDSRSSLRMCLQAAHHQCLASLSKMLAIQEDLDWECYRHFNLIDEDLTELRAKSHERDCFPIILGQRAFEIVLARKIFSGETQSTWFERHGSTPITELPAHWTEEYRHIVERRIELIENDPNIRLIEQPEYKRRWNTESWESQLERALREWLLLRLETYFDFDGRMTDAAEASKRPVPLGEIAMYSVAQLSDVARRDPQFMEVGELYRDDPAFDVQSLVEELVAAESVPHLPILRYKDSGLRKRAEWEKTWDLQRREDAGEAVGTIPVPPKYTSADFISTGGARYWSLRGKLDVPKERWISFPHCEGPDGTLVICWAGYDHLQQAQAISAYYVRVQTEFGGSDDPRLIPLLASLIELLPWLKQWHNEPNANFDGLRMGDYFEGFVNEEARNMGKTLQEIRDWTPPKKVAKKAAPKASKKKSSKKATSEDTL